MSEGVAGASGFGSNWTSYHGNKEDTGLDAAGTTLLPSRAAWTSPTLDGQLFGEPLVADGRVVAATENDTVYVMAADSGHILWSRHLATAVPSNDLPCGDISPEVGITGTPVVDLARHEIFVVADELVKGPAASGGVEASHHLFGLDLFTGTIELDEAAMPNAGEDQLAQLQRPGLTLDDGSVVIAYGQNAGDCPGPNGPAHGYVVAISETGGPLHYFQIGSGQDRGAVWMGGSAPVVDPQGNVYVASADGYDLGAGQPYDDSDAVLELSPTMQLESLFYPSDWQQLSAQDKDLGTGNPVLVDGFVFQIGKTDDAYLLHQGHLGGEEGELASMPLCSGDPDGGRAVEGSVVYVPCPNGVTAVKVSTKPPYMTQLWTDDDGAAGAPIIAGGLIWTIGGDNAVHGLNPANGHEVTSISFGGHANHFPTPAVGDGLLLLAGTDQVIAYMGPAGLPPPPALSPGYWMVASDGGVFNFGDARFFGSLGAVHLNKPVVGIASTPDGRGYWLVASDGGVFNFGDARFFGSLGAVHLNKPVVGIASTPDGRGYWLVASDGGVFSFGDARFFGSVGGVHLNKPVVGMASTRDGRGYWLVASDGGVFNFGDARFSGSLGNIHLNAPIVSEAASTVSTGYWMVAADGGVFGFGDARFFGSMGGVPLNRPIVAMARSADAAGYWLVASDGGVFNFGDAHFSGSLGNFHLNAPIVGTAAAP